MRNEDRHIQIDRMNKIERSFCFVGPLSFPLIEESQLNSKEKRTSTN